MWSKGMVPWAQKICYPTLLEFLTVLSGDVAMHLGDFNPHAGNVWITWKGVTRMIWPCQTEPDWYFVVEHLCGAQNVHKYHV